MQHDLKILPQYFEAIKNEEKTFEVRKKDREYQVGDYLVLQEWDGTNYTGREIIVEVTYILDDPTYCKENMIIMSIDVMLITSENA